VYHILNGVTILSWEGGEICAWMAPSAEQRWNQQNGKNMFRRI